MHELEKELRQVKRALEEMYSVQDPDWLTFQIIRDLEKQKRFLEYELKQPSNYVQDIR